MKIDTTDKESINRTFRRTHALYQRLEGDIDKFVWEVFRKYLKAMGFLFSSPDKWEIVEDSVKILRVDFRGQDGCRGCYNYKSISIPWEFFENFDEALEKHKEMKLKEVKKKKARDEADARAKRKAQFLKLKKEFEG